MHVCGDEQRPQSHNRAFATALCVSRCALLSSVLHTSFATYHIYTSLTLLAQHTSPSRLRAVAFCAVRDSSTRASSTYTSYPCTRSTSSRTMVSLIPAWFPLAVLSAVTRRTYKAQ